MIWSFWYSFRDLPADAAEWSELLQQQKQMHEMEMKRYHDFVDWGRNRLKTPGKGRCEKQ